jgi:hypothetical protein
MPRFLSGNFKKVVLFLVVLGFAGARCLFAAPLNNYTDMVAIYNVQGTDKFYTKKERRQMRLYLSPFYQHTGHARNKHGTKCSTGDRIGQWNMSGLLFGRDAGANAKVATLNGLLVHLHDAGWVNDVDNNAFSRAFYGAGAPYGLIGISSAGVAAALTNDNNDNTGLLALPAYLYLGNEANFNPDVNTASTFSAVQVSHEKMGLRGQLTHEFACGVGFSIKGGFVEYKERPTFEVSRRFRVNVGLESPTKNDAGVIADTDYLDPALAVGAGADGLKAKALQAIRGLYRNLLSPEAREKLFKAVDLDVSEARATAMEDTHMQLFWNIPLEMKEEGEHAVTLVPYISAGVWLPTGKIKNQDKAFSIDTGNGGFYGVTFEAALGFDFPKMIQFNIGGGAIVSMPKSFDGYRVPSVGLAVAAPHGPVCTAIKQSGFYPWKAGIRKTPGLTWYANASLKVDSYNGVMSLFMDYIYSYHEKDTITLETAGLEEAQITSFQYGPKRLEEESVWRSQLFNIGLDYRVMKNLCFGLAVQAPITGVRVFKPTTVLGSMTLLF